MLEALITSKTKLKLLLKFFLNTSNTGYLRGLAAEFNESTNAVRLELNKLEEAGLIESRAEGPRKIFRANPRHPLFTDIQSIIRKFVGVDEIIEQVINHLGEPDAVYLLGDLAQGIDSPDLNMIIIGENIDLDYLETLVAKAQKIISRKIGYAVFTTAEFIIQYPHLDDHKLLPVWQKNPDTD